MHYYSYHHCQDNLITKPELTIAFLIQNLCVLTPDWIIFVTVCSFRPLRFLLIWVFTCDSWGLCWLHRLPVLVCVFRSENEVSRQDADASKRRYIHISIEF